MLGIKTKLTNLLTSRINNITNGKLTNDLSIREIMKTFRADELGHRASTKKADMGYGFIHYGLVRSMKPKDVLCIGSRHGYIPAVLAQACKDNKQGVVYFVDAGYGKSDKDNWTGDGYWKSMKGKNIFKKYGLQKHINLYVMTTDSYKKKFPTRKYDYVYIDGDHSYKGVSRDFHLFWPKLSVGGLMLFHDISISTKKPEGEYGVNKFWKEKSKINSISFNFSASGLGILQKTK